MNDKPTIKEQEKVEESLARVLADIKAGRIYEWKPTGEMISLQEKILAKRKHESIRT